MGWDRDTVQQRLRTIAPKCLHATCSEPEQDIRSEDGMVITAWRITVGANSSTSCSVVGNPTLINSEPPSLLLFGNLGIKGNGVLVELFDPIRHGYHNEIARLEGEAEDTMQHELADDRKEYTCPICSSAGFLVTAFFYYQEGAIEVFLEESNLPISDMFNAFYLSGVCVNCHTESRIAEFDGL